jgi:hypothetical protein
MKEVVGSLLVLAALAAPVAFSACGGDDDGDGKQRAETTAPDPGKARAKAPSPDRPDRDTRREKTRAKREKPSAGRERPSAEAPRERAAAIRRRREAEVERQKRTVPKRVRRKRDDFAKFSRCLRRKLRMRDRPGIQRCRDRYLD